MVEVETVVYYVLDGMKRRLYRTERTPTRYYYLVDNKQVEIAPEDIPKEVLSIIPTKNRK
jgi:hypothetical protein